MSRVVAVISVVGICFVSGADAASPLELLLPKPVKAEARAGEADAAICAKVSARKGCVPDAPSAVAAEAYVLEVSPDGVEIVSSDPRGERYARATLAQLLNRPILPIAPHTAVK